MIVISDSSTIINLAAIGQLELLRQFFGKVVLPEAVLSEVLAGGPLGPGFEDVSQSDWLEVRAIKDRSALSGLAHLDLGEAEAIVLTQEMTAGLLLIDEIDGRTEALKRGLRIIGLLGILTRAKREGRIEAVGPLVLRLRNEMRFRVSERLFRQVLQDVGELGN
jgi:predicted nucleic acid-binding protein